MFMLILCFDVEIHLFMNKNEFNYEISEIIEIDVTTLFIIWVKNPVVKLTNNPYCLFVKSRVKY